MLSPWYAGSQMVRNEKESSDSSFLPVSLPADTLFFLHSWPTACEASPDDISHRRASAYRLTSHHAHDVGNVQTILVVASGD